MVGRLFLTVLTLLSVEIFARAEECVSLPNSGSLVINACATNTQAVQGSVFQAYMVLRNASTETVVVSGAREYLFRDIWRDHIAGLKIVDSTGRIWSDMEWNPFYFRTRSWERRLGLQDFLFYALEVRTDTIPPGRYNLRFEMRDSLHVGRTLVIPVRILPQPTQVEVGSTPMFYTLAQNYPNPFNPMTTIAYQLPKSEQVKLEVVDLLGRHVAVLVDGVMPAGNHVIPFDASGLATGVYLYRLRAGAFVETKRMAVLR